MFSVRIAGVEPYTPVPSPQILDFMYISYIGGHGQIRLSHSRIHLSHSQIRSSHSQIRSSHSQVRSSHSRIHLSHSQIRSSHSSIRSSQNLASITSPRFCQNFQKLQNVRKKK